MKSNHLLFSFKFLKENNKKYIWAIVLSALSFLISILLMPILYLQSNQNINGGKLSEYSLKVLTEFITIDNISVKVMIVFLAIAVGTSIFSYLHSKNKVDFYHSLPISRGSLFINNYIIGIIIVIPIYIIVMCITLLCYKVLGYGEIINTIDVLKGIFANIVFYISIYSITIFANIITGNTLISVLLSGVLLTSNSIIFGVCSIIKDIFLKGTYLNEFTPTTLNTSVLFNYFWMNDSNHLQYMDNMDKTGITISYLAISIIMFIVCYILFKIRKSESAGSCIAFKPAKTILKYLSVVLSSIVIGVVLYLLTNESIVWLFAGIFVSTVILHCFVEIVYAFDFKSLFKNWYSIIGCFIIASVVILGAKNDIFKLEEKIISINKVEGINASASYYDYNALEQENEYLKNIENIERVQYLERDYIEKKSLYELEEYNTYPNLYIYYKLKDGKTIYKNIILEKNNPDMIGIINSKEYIENAKIFNNKPRNIKIINTNGKITGLENKELIEFLSLLKEDMIEYGLNQEIEPAFIMEIEYRAGSEDEYGDIIEIDRIENEIAIFENYKKTNEYLKERGILYDEIINLEEIKSIDIRGYNSNLDTEIKITKEKDQQQVIENAIARKFLKNDKEETKQYSTTVTLIDGEEIYMFLSEDIAIDLINKYK